MCFKDILRVLLFFFVILCFFYGVQGFGELKKNDKLFGSYNEEYSFFVVKLRKWKENIELGFEGVVGMLFMYIVIQFVNFL